MKKITKLIFLVAIVSISLASCTTFKISGVQVTSDIPSYDTVGTFDINVKVAEFFGTTGGANLFNITSDAMDTKIYDAIQREIQKFTGDAAVNIEIEYKSGLLDMLANSFTVYIYAPATAHVTGTIVKYN